MIIARNHTQGNKIIGITESINPIKLCVSKDLEQSMYFPNFVWPSYNNEKSLRANPSHMSTIWAPFGF